MRARGGAECRLPPALSDTRVARAGDTKASVAVAPSFFLSAYFCAAWRDAAFSKGLDGHDVAGSNALSKAGATVSTP